MFLSRPRVRFDGCYISRVTYVRPGEHSFQDESYRLEERYISRKISSVSINTLIDITMKLSIIIIYFLLNYRPWHMVEYFRYIRFFPDGKVLFLTTADKPGVTVASLRDRKPRNIATMRGRYHLYGNNVVSAVVTKTKISTPHHQEHDGRRHNSRRHKPPPQLEQETTFHMDFEIEEMRNRSNWALRWTYYALTLTNSNPAAARGNNNRNNNPELNTGLTTTFELSSAKYPPLYFSRVKSYTNRTDSILE